MWKADWPRKVLPPGTSSPFRPVIQHTLAPAVTASLSAAVCQARKPPMENPRVATRRASTRSREARNPAARSSSRAISPASELPRCSRVLATACWCS
ncbi:hypothetical protein SFUMM280S_06943 [Streptomyces fumanus]